MVVHHQITSHLTQVHIHLKSPQSRSNKRSCSVKQITSLIKAMIILSKIKMKAASIIILTFLTKEITVVNSSLGNKHREGKGRNRCSSRWVEVVLSRGVVSSNHLRVSSSNSRNRNHLTKASATTTSSFISSLCKLSIVVDHSRPNNCSRQLSNLKPKCHLRKKAANLSPNLNQSIWHKSYASSS